MVKMQEGLNDSFTNAGTGLGQEDKPCGTSFCISIAFSKSPVLLKSKSSCMSLKTIAVFVQLKFPSHYTWDYFLVIDQADWSLLFGTRFDYSVSK